MNISIGTEDTKGPGLSSILTALVIATHTSAVLLFNHPHQLFQNMIFSQLWIERIHVDKNKYIIPKQNCKIYVVQPPDQPFQEIYFSISSYKTSRSLGSMACAFVSWLCNKYNVKI